MAFLRRIYNRYHKLGKKKPNRVWRKPKGRDNKMREKRRGYSPVVSIGYKQKSSERKDFLVVRNIRDLSEIKKGQEITLGNVGKKKKIEMVKKAEEKGILIRNLNIKKFLKNLGEKNESK